MRDCAEVHYYTQLYCIEKTALKLAPAGGSPGWVSLSFVLVLAAATHGRGLCGCINGTGALAKRRRQHKHSAGLKAPGASSGQTAQNNKAKYSHCKTKLYLSDSRLLSWVWNGDCLAAQSNRRLFERSLLATQNPDQRRHTQQDDTGESFCEKLHRPCCNECNMSLCKNASNRCAWGCAAGLRWLTSTPAASQVARRVGPAGQGMC